MHTAVAILCVCATASLFSDSAYSQDKIPYQEFARVIVNATETPSVIASVTLQSTSLEDLRIESTLAGQIAVDDRLAYIALTNEESCVLGVFDESCIVVSILRSGEWEGIDEIQQGAREIGDSYIDGLNESFDTRAEFHSVYIHFDEEARLGQASDRRIVSAVYTMPREDTASMFEKIGGIILSTDIRQGGGFYDIAKYVYSANDADMLFSITPIAGSHLMQMRISSQFPIEDPNTISPAALLSTDKIERSDVFREGTSPLGSLVQVVIVSPEKMRLATSGSPILATRSVEGEQVPLAIDSPGWVFDPAAGKQIKGKYIFGTENVIEGNELVFTVRPQMPSSPDPVPRFEVAPEIIIIALAVIVGGVVAAWFLTRRD